MAIRKKFIGVEIPLLKTEIPVLGTPASLKSKTIKLDLTRKLKGRALEAVFQIFSNEENLVAYPKKLKLMTSFIRRMMRKKTSYVEDTFKAKCSDISCIIKPFLITRKKVSRAVRKNLRNTSRELILKYVKEKNYIDLCNDILNKELQQTILLRLKKIYPLSFCEIRVIETKDLDKAEKPEKKIGETSKENKTEEQEISIENKQEKISEPKQKNEWRKTKKTKNPCSIKTRCN